MATSSISPQVIKGGLILMDATTGVVQRITILQYNPDTLTRTLYPISKEGSYGSSRLNQQT